VTRATTETAELVRARAGFRCEKCGTRSSLRWSIHHRIPRGMGGSKNPILNSPANLLLLCGSGTEGCHGWVESNRTESYAAGLLLRRWQDPLQEPVTLHHGTYLLTDAGGVQPC